MNYKAIRYYLGNILWVEAAFMLPSVGLMLLDGEQNTRAAFAVTITALMVIGALLRINTNENRLFFAREGFVITALSWIAVSAFGALPFVLSGYIPSFIDAFFETVSGFTTTGATILTDIEALPRSLLHWRSFTHWIGGMGVLVFLLAIMPKGGNSLHVLRAESPGPQVDKLVPKMRKSAVILYKIYIVMTIIQIILLVAGGMDLFDAVVHSYATAGTGGFSVKNNSIAYYDSFYLQGVIGVFMMLFGINFNIYYLIVMRHFTDAFKNEELKAYKGIYRNNSGSCRFDCP